MRRGLYSLVLLLFLLSCESRDEADNQPVTPSGEAFNQVESLAKQYPDSLGLQLKLVNAYDSVGNAKQALIHLDNLVNKDKGNYGLWFRKAQLELSLGDTLAATSSLNAALKIYPSAEAMLNLANLYAEARNPVALQLVNNVLKMGLGRETDAHCHFISGIYYARLRKIEDAEKAFDKCIANNYTYMEAYIEKGLLYFDAKQYRRAHSIFQFASTVNNLYADAYYFMARCLEELGVKDSAILRFEQALSLDKDLVEAQTALKRLGAQ